jgi:hypothetical protein
MQVRQQRARAETGENDPENSNRRQKTKRIEKKTKKPRRRDEGWRAGNGNFTEGQAKRTLRTYLRRPKKKRAK